MATVRAFRALRPTPASAPRVAAVPYDVVSRDEAKALAAGNPLSFLHVSRPEIDLPPETDPHADVVYATAVANYEKLKRAAPLVVDDVPNLYLYRLESGSHAQTGVAACYSLDEYDGNVIRKHERTRRDKEDDRTRHMIALRAQTGPVFLTYRASAEVDAAAERITANTPLFDFEAPDGVRHSVWLAPGDEVSNLMRAFEQIPALYIADGHHRAASAARSRRELRANSSRSEPRGTAPESCGCDTFLAVAFPDTQVQILPYNRIVKDLTGQSAEAFLATLKQRFIVTPGPATPSRRGDVAMFLGGRWYTVALDSDARGSDRPKTAGEDVISRLDVTVLQERILSEMLEIGDVRTDKRIDFIGGARGAGELERLVREGHAAVAFSMFPVGVHDLMSIADADEIMPPKSTWFEPKLRDGLLIHMI
jgi:uncharacterized protein (DUF1015 family)